MQLWVKVKNTFLTADDENDKEFEEVKKQAQERNCKSAPSPRTINKESDEDFLERQHQEELESSITTGEPDNLHPVFHRQDLTKNIECMKKDLGILEELLRKDPVHNCDVAGETHKYIRDLGNIQKDLQEALASMDRSLDSEKERVLHCMQRESAEAEPVHANSESLPQVMSPQTVMQQPQQLPQQQMQQPQPQQPLVFERVKEGKYFPDAGTHAVLACTKVLQSEATKRNCRRLVKNVLLVRSDGVNLPPLSMTVTLNVESKLKTLNCKEVTLTLDGQALATPGGCTRYKVWMYAGDTELSGNERPDDLGNGWHDSKIIDFADHCKCMKSDIDLTSIFDAGGKYIYLGVLLVPMQ